MLDGISFIAKASREVMIRFPSTGTHPKFWPAASGNHNLACLNFRSSVPSTTSMLPGSSSCRTYQIIHQVFLTRIQFRHPFDLPFRDLANTWQIDLNILTSKTETFRMQGRLVCLGTLEERRNASLFKGIPPSLFHN